MQISDKNREARGIALTAIICAVLQLAIAPNVGLGNGRANLALVFAATVALTSGGGRVNLRLPSRGSTTSHHGTNRPHGAPAERLRLRARRRGQKPPVGRVCLGNLALRRCRPRRERRVWPRSRPGQGGFVDAVFLRLPFQGAALSLVCFLPFAYFESTSGRVFNPAAQPLQRTLGRRAWISRFSS